MDYKFISILLRVFEKNMKKFNRTSSDPMYKINLNRHRKKVGGNRSFSRTIGYIDIYIYIYIYISYMKNFKLQCWVLSKEASSTIFWVFSMTRAGTETHSLGPLAICWKFTTVQIKDFLNLPWSKLQNQKWDISAALIKSNQPTHSLILQLKELVVYQFLWKHFF